MAFVFVCSRVTFLRTQLFLKMVDVLVCIVEIVRLVPQLSFEILNNSRCQNTIAGWGNNFRDDMRLLCSFVN